MGFSATAVVVECLEDCLQKMELCIEIEHQDRLHVTGMISAMMLTIARTTLIYATLHFAVIELIVVNKGTSLNAYTDCQVEHEWLG